MFVYICLLMYIVYIFIICTAVLYKYYIIKIVEFILYFFAISTIFITHKLEDYVYPYILYLYSIIFCIDILKNNNRINHKL